MIWHAITRRKHSREFRRIQSSKVLMHNTYLLYKIEWFIDFPAINKIDNLTCVIIDDQISVEQDQVSRVNKANE